MPSINLIFTRRDWLIALLVILLAFSYRMIVIMDRAYAPNQIAAFDPLLRGSDQYTYYNQYLGFADGTYPPDKFFYQPGLPYFLLIATSILRTDNLGALRVLTAALAAINCGVMIAIGRLATGRRDVGILSGVLLAVYPVSVFYDTDFVITSQALILATLALFGTLWLWRNPHQWVGAVLLGFATGAATFTRLEIAALAPACGLWLIAVRRDRRAILQIVVAAVVAIAVTAPTVIHNRIGGADYLFTPVGPTEVYRGNNRVADGTYGDSNATASTHFDYFSYLVKDIALEPVRFVELILHKTALFLSESEPGNNLNYVLSGEQISPALALNPLNFSVLLALTLFGLALMLRDQQREVVALLILSFGGITFMILLIWVEARLRTPVIVTMIPAASYGVMRLLDLLRTEPTKKVARQTLPIAVGIAIALVVIQIGFEKLPRKLTVSALPADATPAHVIYDDTLELVGWKTQEQYSPQNIITPFTPYVITLYWRVSQPTTVDYSFALKYLLDGEQIIGVDRPVGTVVFPGRRTSQFTPNTIYEEHIGMSYPGFDGPAEQSGTLELTVYPERDFAATLPGITADATVYDSVILGQPAIRYGDGYPPAIEATTEIHFGDVLTLTGWQFPETATPGEMLTVDTLWQTTAQQIRNSYAIGVYIFQGDDFITNVDSPPHDGDFLTLSIPTNYIFNDPKTLQLPDDPGEYAVYIGIYDQVTQERLPVPDSADGLYRIGSIIVAE